MPFKAFISLEAAPAHETCHTDDTKKKNLERHTLRIWYLFIFSSPQNYTWHLSNIFISFALFTLCAFGIPLLHYSRCWNEKKKRFLEKNQSISFVRMNYWIYTQDLILWNSILITDDNNIWREMNARICFAVRMCVVDMLVDLVRSLSLTICRTNDILTHLLLTSQHESRNDKHFI